MIVCHCQNITDRDINNAIDWMRASDVRTVITAGKIYRALGKAADCGGCMPLLLDTMRHCDSFGVAPPILRGRAITSGGTPDEGRRKGYRLSQRRATV